MADGPGPVGAAHQALLLLADLDGRLTPEFLDWDGDLLLEPGSLVPAWYPWTVEGEELSAEERNAQFSFDLDLLLASRRPAPSATGPWTARDVLRSLLELRAVWRVE